MYPTAAFPAHSLINAISHALRPVDGIAVPLFTEPTGLDVAATLEKGTKVGKNSMFRNKKYFSYRLEYHKGVMLCLGVYQGLLLLSNRVSATQKRSRC